MNPIPDEFIIGTLGRLGVGIFAFYLALMIFDSRRDSKTDKSLAAVLFTWGIVEVIDAYRYSQNLVFLPFYLSRAGWVLTLLVEAVAVYFIRRERNATRERDKTRIDAP